MNLADITTKCYILALIIRDDGERLLLGDGAYEFKDSQQHFIANTYANDVVELQGTDGQMLAGQVRRTATQTFAGYIGDATFSKQKVEEARRDFLMFFRKKHYYTAVYVFSDGTAIQRKRGYIVNAPSAPELYQRFPEWSIGLNFEDPNYYEYAEDEHGDEIAAHLVQLELSTAMSGGLIWDEDGAVSDDLSYVGTEIEGEGKNFQLADTGTATLKSAELLGDATQTTYSGKNLADSSIENFTPANATISEADGILKMTANSGVLARLPLALPELTGGTTYTISCDIRAVSIANNGATTHLRVREQANGGSWMSSASPITLSSSFTQYVIAFTPTTTVSPYLWFYLSSTNTNQNNVEIYVKNIQLEVGSTATAYEPYVGGTASPNPDYPQAVNTVTGEQTVKIEGKNLFSGDISQFVNQGGDGSTYTYFKLPTSETYTLTLKAKNDITASGRYIGFSVNGGNANGGLKWVYANTTATAGQTFSYNNTYAGPNAPFVSMYPKTANDLQWLVDNFDIQLELGSTATAFEPYQGQTLPVNLGKNLFDVSQATMANIYMNTNGWTSASNDWIGTNSYIAVEPNTTYTLSSSASSGTQVAINQYTSESRSAFISPRIDTATFTTSATARFISFSIKNPNATNFQLEKGTQATSFAPFLVTKNLFDMSQVIKGRVDNGAIGYESGTSDLSVSGDTISFTTTATYRGVVSGLIPVKPSTAYSFTATSTANSRYVDYYDESGVWISRATGLSGIDFSTTTPANCYGMRISFMLNSAGSATITKPQLELGSVVTPYEPYGTPYELAKIGTYQDRIYKTDGKWYIEKQVGEFTLDGTQTSTSYTARTNTFRAIFQSGITGLGSGNADNRLSKSERFTSDTGIWANDIQGFYVDNANVVVSANISLVGNTIASMKAWFASNPTKFYAPLATPTTTEITNSELVGQLERLKHAHTYADITNFSITATSPNLPAYLKVVAFGDDAIPQGGYVWEDGGAGGATTITVDGVDNAQPIWTVVGPATNPSLTNITTGESIQWTGVVPNGQTLVVNMADMTASLSGANVFEFISGSWITLQAGNNRVSYSATAATGIATLEWNGVVG